MEFNCKNCGKIDMVQFDGVYIDTSLRGIIFEVTDKNGVPRVNMREQDTRFYSDDVVKDYEKTAQNFATELQLAKCPKCEAEINIEYFQKVKDDEIATKMADEQAKSMNIGNIAKTIKRAITGK